VPLRDRSLAAAADLSRGKIGVPLFDTALLTCSIVTGQVLAYALTAQASTFDGAVFASSNGLAAVVGN
jgi:hypothetical protein